MSKLHKEAWVPKETVTVYDYAEDFNISPSLARYRLEKLASLNVITKYYDTQTVEVFHTMASYRDHDFVERRFAFYRPGPKYNLKRA